MRIKEKNSTKNKGITLIALVITIVVLIILSSVMLGVIIGQNGLLSRTKQAKEEYLLKANEEQVEIANAGSIDSSRDAVAAANPAGTIITYAASTPPEGYLACDGQEVSRTDYSDLFNIIGTTYGEGDGSTTFNLPDLTDRYLKGSATAGTYQDAGLPNITGILDTWVDIGRGSSGAFYYSKAVSGYPGVSYLDNNRNNRLFFDASRSNNIYGKSTTVTPKNMSVVYCIKY